MFIWTLKYEGKWDHFRDFNDDTCIKKGCSVAYFLVAIGAVNGDQTISRGSSMHSSASCTDGLELHMINFSFIINKEDIFSFGISITSRSLFLS